MLARRDLVDSRRRSLLGGSPTRSTEPYTRGTKFSLLAGCPRVFAGATMQVREPRRA